MSSLVGRVDRLVLDEDGEGDFEIECEQEELELPEEELLRLDDGTPLPAELAELRALLQLHSSSASVGVFEAAGEDGGPTAEHSAQLASLSAAKAEALQDCLLSFDENVLMLHDKLLDHEELCKQLESVRNRHRVVAAGGARGSEPAHGSEGKGAAEAGGAEDEEEALDQRVARSRQALKALLQAQQGIRPPAVGAAKDGGSKGAGSKGALPPVVPPPKGRHTSYSMRLRSNTATWGAKYAAR